MSGFCSLTHPLYVWVPAAAMPPKGTWTEENLMDAWYEVHDEGFSLSSAARRHGVPKATLSKRMKGQTLPRDHSTHPGKRLTTAEEQRLVTWILRQDSIGQAPSSYSVRCLAGAILKARGDVLPLGVHWMEGFKRRNPSIRSLKARKQEASRFSGFTPKAVN